jgi:hypothetical protein
MRTISVKETLKTWRRLPAAVGVVVGLTTLVPVASAQGGNPNPRVLPIHSSPFGSTYGEWSARWWQWVFSMPAVGHPLVDETGERCGQGQTGKVWFLAGTVAAPGNPVTVTRDCTVPQGKALFIPILNATFGAAVFDCEPTVPGIPCDVTALRAAAAASMDQATLEVDIDGVQLQNLSEYRVQSPVFSVTAPADSLLPIPSGTYAPMVSDGYWLMLTPLSRGAHTIHITGAVTGGVFAGTAFELTYHLMVGR